MIELKEVCKTYNSGGVPFMVSKNITLHIQPREFAILLGESGTGKSTILNIISGLETVDQGQVIIDKVDISHYSQDQLADFRKENLGFVFQTYNLIPNLTVRENVELIAKMKKNSLDVDVVLEQVGLSHRLESFPNQLSGGEQQRVSIARALVKKPKILLCDEPTGALDNQTSHEILTLLQNLPKQYDTTVLMVTHNRAIMEMANLIVEVSDGEILKQTTIDHPKPVNCLNW
ncbi:ABC transporter ATP-binding protein [Vagococcus sp. BWB3-3]|uniref:ABC transporter ATP-binding protein n=1 Tax=Vagococcus allomyrinae TaxID=2794353 RepID=A0A940P7I5_9ENTE|nr:ABC transporter ATP-binding protein [Vagococcus allomyrinae]MBP1039490.1 ABC transporter ATP-binding protein [Vagococcus allomyrinae]